MRGAWRAAFLSTIACWRLVGVGIAQEQGVDSAPFAFVPSALLGPPAQGDSDGRGPLAGLNLTGEFLYLWPNRDGLGMAVVSNNSNGLTYSSLESLSWDGTPAFRIGGRYCLPQSQLELGAVFTYLHAKSQRTVSAPEGGSLQGIFAADRRAQDATDADGDAGLSYALLDLDVGKSVCVSEWLQLRTFGGVRLASINQTLKSIYSGGALGENADYVNSPIRIYGAGLTAGGEATLEVYRGWGLYGRGRLGLLSSSFNSRRTETIGSSLVIDETDRYFTVIPVAELGAGLSYRSDRVSFGVGFEMTDWLNMVSGIGDATSNGALTVRKRSDLTLEGLSVRLGFSF